MKSLLHIRKGRRSKKSRGGIIFAAIVTSMDIREPHVRSFIQSNDRRTKKDLKRNLSVKKINKKSNYRK